MIMDKQSKIILISGPTASGKSNFALKIAKKINGEIINADSMQVYKSLKILTARPTKKHQGNIKHHLYGVVNLDKNFSVGQWLKGAIKNSCSSFSTFNSACVLSPCLKLDIGRSKKGSNPRMARSNGMYSPKGTSFCL